MLKKLLGKKEKRASSSTPTLTNELTQSILGVVGAKSIPSMEGAAQKAFQLSTDPEAKAHDFIEVIESDEGLSARIIKIANSVYFDRGHGSKTIEESVVTIGTEELRNLLCANSLSDIFPTNHPVRSQLWKHDTAVGIVAQFLAKRFLPDKERHAFLAGLMHDVGKLLLLQRAANDYEFILQKVKQGAEFCAAEEERFPFNHTEVGHVIGERWNFSDELNQVIRVHHRGWDELQDNGFQLGGLIKASDLLVHSLGVGFEREYVRFHNKSRLKLDEAWKYLGVSSPEGREIAKNAQRTLNKEFDLYLAEMES